MTQIHISIRKPKTGGLAPVTGVMRFRPVRRHFDAAKNLVIAASFDAYLSETGELTVDLLPTTGACTPAACPPAPRSARRTRPS